MERSTALAALCAVLLSGCTEQMDAAQKQAVQQDQTGGVEETRLLSEAQAQKQVLAPLSGTCSAVLTEEILSVCAADGAEHAYFVFEVSGAEGTPVGKAAVDRTTGEAYYYLGDGVLEDYTAFPLYDAAASDRQSWAGVYLGENGRTLTGGEEEEGGAARFSQKGKPERPVLCTDDGAAYRRGEQKRCADLLSGHASNGRKV